MSRKTPRNAFWEHFSDLEEPRSEGRNFTYSLQTIVTLAVIGLCCEQNSFSKIENFLSMQWEWFAPYFPGHEGPPSRVTFQRVFGAISPTQFESCFTRWSESIVLPNDEVDSESLKVIAVDGKTVRNSGRSSERPLHLVSAWASNSGLVLGQVETLEKSNEIEAIPRLLKMLDIQGSVVTIDAMGCQKNIANAIVENEADYLLACKANHKTMYQELKTYFASVLDKEIEADDFYEESDKGHGRIETRRCWMVRDIDWFEDKEQWQGLRSFIFVQAERIVNEKISIQNKYYISSLENASAKKLLSAAREHWGIENKHHWVMDVVYQEDKACVRDKNRAHNIAAARRISTNIIKSQDGYKGSPSGARMAAAFDLKFRKQLMISMV